MATLGHELDDEARERWRASLQEEDDVEVIVTLLAMQKIAEHSATGPPASPRYLAQCEEDGVEIQGGA